jgi:ElaB/YqjD/DUF883 family membrane-anchored ribosome-binding protein
MDKVLEDLRTLVRDGQELLQVSVGNLKARANVGAQRTEQVLRERPYQTIGVAFAAGLLSGIVLAGAFSRSSSED